MQIRRRAIHVTADGRRLLVTHGDDYDGITHFGGLQERFGDWLYYRILTGNQWLNRLRRKGGLRYWSLADCSSNAAALPNATSHASCRPAWMMPASAVWMASFAVTFIVQH